MAPARGRHGTPPSPHGPRSRRPLSSHGPGGPWDDPSPLPPTATAGRCRPFTTPPKEHPACALQPASLRPPSSLPSTPCSPPPMRSRTTGCDRTGRGCQWLPGARRAGSLRPARRLLHRHVGPLALAGVSWHLQLRLDWRRAAVGLAVSAVTHYVAAVCRPLALGRTRRPRPGPCAAERDSGSPEARAPVPCWILSAPSRDFIPTVPLAALIEMAPGMAALQLVDPRRFRGRASRTLRSALRPCRWPRPMLQCRRS